jgi:hypothetical protein
MADIVDDPGPANLTAMMLAVDLSAEAPDIPDGLSPRVASISNPDDDWESLKWPPWVEFSGIEVQNAADAFLADPWDYFLTKYNADKLIADEARLKEIRGRNCPTGGELATYLVKREIDRERSQSQPLHRRGDLEWCRRREDLDQQAIHEVLRTGLSKERGRGRGSLCGQSGRRN